MEKDNFRRLFIEEQFSKFESCVLGDSQPQPTAQNNVVYCIQYKFSTNLYIHMHFVACFQVQIHHPIRDVEIKTEQQNNQTLHSCVCQKKNRMNDLLHQEQLLQDRGYDPLSSQLIALMVSKCSIAECLWHWVNVCSQSWTPYLAEQPHSEPNCPYSQKEN